MWGKAGKDTATLDAFFADLGPERARQVEAVSMDMGPAFAKSVRADGHAPQATICIDPFHAVKLVGEALDDERRKAWNELRQAGSPEAVRKFKGARWALLKRPENLTDERCPPGRILAAARAGQQVDPDDAHLARVIEYDVPDRDGNGSGELIVLLSTITDPVDAHADELADTYHQRWEEETTNDQLKTHLRGPGRVLRSRLPALVHQEIWAWLSVHYAIAALIARAAEAADLDPDRISFTRALRIVRRTATGTAAIPPSGLG